MRGCRALAVVVMVLCASASAHASEAAAKEHFESGRRLARAEHWEEAAAEFRTSLALEPSVGGYLNLGNCYSKLGQPAAAVDQFRRAEELAGQGDPERAAEARTRREALMPRVPTIVVDASSSKAITLDGRPALADTPIEVEPGAHDVVVRPPIGEARTYRVVVKIGDHAEVRASESSSDPPSVDEPRVERGSSPLRTVGFVSAGVGLASLTVASIVYALAVSDKGDLEGACAEYPRCRADEVERARSIDDSARSYATIATVGLVAGAALVVGGVLLIVGSPRTPARAVTAFASGAAVRW